MSRQLWPRPASRDDYRHCRRQQVHDRRACAETGVARQVIPFKRPDGRVIRSAARRRWSRRDAAKSRGGGDVLGEEARAQKVRVPDGFRRQLMVARKQKRSSRRSSAVQQAGAARRGTAQAPLGRCAL